MRATYLYPLMLALFVSEKPLEVLEAAFRVVRRMGSEGREVEYLSFTGNFGAVDGLDGLDEREGAGRHENLPEASTTAGWTAIR